MKVWAKKQNPAFPSHNAVTRLLLRLVPTHHNLLTGHARHDIRILTIRIIQTVLALIQFPKLTRHAPNQAPTAGLVRARFP